MADRDQRDGAPAETPEERHRKFADELDETRREFEEALEGLDELAGIRHRRNGHRDGSGPGNGRPSRDR